MFKLLLILLMIFTVNCDDCHDRLELYSRFVMERDAQLNRCWARECKLSAYVDFDQKCAIVGLQSDLAKQFADMNLVSRVFSEAYSIMHYALRHHHQ